MNAGISLLGIEGAHPIYGTEVSGRIRFVLPFLHVFVPLIFRTTQGTHECSYLLYNDDSIPNIHFLYILSGDPVAEPCFSKDQELTGPSVLDQ